MIPQPTLNSSARLIVTNPQAPEDYEQGKLLCGSRGRVLYGLLRSAGLDIKTISSCTPEQLPGVLKTRNWERIDIIDYPGAKVNNLRQLTGLTEGVMKWRGSPVALKGEATRRCMPILDPIYLMKDSAYIPATVSDLQKGLQVPPQNYVLFPTVEEVAHFTAENLCFDIETAYPSRRITVVGIAKDIYNVLVVPFTGNYIPHLRRIFSQAKSLIGQNIIGFDIPVLEENGIAFDPTAQIWDIMLMHHLVQPDCPHDLEFIASICTQMVAWKQLSHDQPEFYNACDVDATLQSFRELLPRMRFLGLEDLYKYVQVPLAKICKQMHDGGIRLDPNKAALKRVELLKDVERLEALLPDELKPYDQIKKKRQKAPAGTLGKAGKPVKYIHVPFTERQYPWASPKKVENYLYKTLKLPVQLHRKTKKPTSDKLALAKLYRMALADNEPYAPFLKGLRDLRGVELLLTDYFKEDDSHAPVSTIHSNFLVHGTNSGRLASSGPNMQNVPKQASYIYVPSHPGWCFVEADFSSLENRLAAWYANDTPRLERLAVPGFNEHLWLARKIYGNHVTKDDPEYKLGKITNHGADGAMGPRMLANTHDLEEKVAKDLIFQWRKINHLSADWQNRVGNEATSKGVLTNAFGRKRWFYSHSAYTEGIRFLPQSSGADICYRSMVSLAYEAIGWPAELVLKVSSVLAPLPAPSRIVLQVHDSILVECPLHLREKVVECLRLACTQPWPQLGGYSIPVEIKVGNPSDSWAELQVVK